MERLLTDEEILNINIEFQTNPIYRVYNLRKFYREDFPITEILSVSEKNDLIMIKGNSETGFDHISERHNYYSTNIYTTQKENGSYGELRFQFPNKFPAKLAPIHFIKIADQIFEPCNADKEKNKNPELFDLYCSSVIFNEAIGPELVILLLYKNTKIIHTLYPKSEPKSRKKKRLENFSFQRDKVLCNYKTKSLLQIEIPYLNTNKEHWYSILIEKDFIKESEYWSIVIFQGNEISKMRLELGEQPIQVNHFYRSSYQKADLRHVEKYIKEIDSQFRSGQLTITI